MASVILPIILMADNTDISYSHRDKSWGEGQLYSEQEDILRSSENNNVLDKETSLAPFWVGLFWGGIFASTAVISAIAGASLTQFDLVSNTVGNLLVAYNSQNSFLSSASTESSNIPHLTRTVNLLLVGSNEFDDSQPVTTLLLKFEPKNNIVQITSVPQERQLEIPGVGLGTIQEAYDRGGIEMVARVVNKTLDSGEIDRYIRATPKTLSKLIDLLGGVEVFIPQKSFNNQVKQSVEYISGWQTLDGEQIVTYLLQDNRDNRFEQIQQKQMLIEAVRQRLHHPNFAANLTETTQTLQNYLDTDLSLLEMESLLSFLHQLERNEVAVKLMPDDELKQKSPADNFVISTDSSDRATDSEQLTYSGYGWRNIPIAIQNTTNNPELSLQVLEYLIGRGFYNVYLDRHLSLKLRETEIIVPANNLDAASHLQKVLRLGKLEIFPVNSTNSELTVRIGEDAKFRFLENSLIK